LNASTIYLGGTAIGVDATGNLNANVAGYLFGNIIGTTGQFTNLTVDGTTALTGTATLNGVGLATLGGSASFSSVNGTPLGNATPSTGAFTTLTATGNTAVTNSVYAQGIYDNSVRVVSTSTGTGNLNITSGCVSLPLTGPGTVTAGGTGTVPIIITDTYGRVAGLTTTIVATTFGVQGTSGFANMTSAGTTSGVLRFASTNGVTSAVTVANAQSSTVTINTAQDLRTTATPTFSGLLPSGNVTANIGSSTTWWNTIFGKAIQAQYADLAEKYTSDAEYAPGTVVVFGGNDEITVTTEFADTRVAGAISTDPAYLMNGECDGLPVALRGRVPCQVVGPVTKGDLLVTSTTPGYAVSVGNDKSHGVSVFAKSLTTDLSEGTKVITAVIL
jgi:hypothetical protein